MLVCSVGKVNNLSCLVRKSIKGRLARAKHCQKEESEAAYIQTPSRDTILVGHTKIGSSFKKNGDGWIVHEEITCASPTPLCHVDFSKENEIHRPSGANLASGKANRRQYLSRKILLRGPWNASRPIQHRPIGRISTSFWMIGNVSQLMGHYKLNLWRGTMHLDEGRVARKSIKP